jgi:hypothetical protein
VYESRLSFLRKEHEKCEFDVHEVYAIDILVSTGDGKAKEKDSRTTVYKRTPNMYSLKMKTSRGTLMILPLIFSQQTRNNTCAKKVSQKSVSFTR